MAKTRSVISSQRVFNSRQRSAESLRSLARSSLLLAAESWAAMPASLSASASESVTATPKTFSSLRVSSFIACLLFAAAALHEPTVPQVHGGSRRLDPLYRTNRGNPLRPDAGADRRGLDTRGRRRRVQALPA